MKHLVKFKRLHLNKVTGSNQLKETVIRYSFSEEIMGEDSKHETLDVAPVLKTFQDTLFGNIFGMEPPKSSLSGENENKKTINL